MLRLSILILIQLTYTRSTTKPYVTYYWKTSSVTDSVYDYWNHGPIFIPGLHHVFSMTTKQADMFPPWLTQSQPTTQTFRTTNYELKEKKTFKPNTTQRIRTTASTLTIITTVTEKAKPTEHTKHDVTKKTQKTDVTEKTQKTDVTEKTHKTDATKRPRPTLFSFEEAPKDGATIPFSAFLRKILRVLAVKNYSELPPLFKPFSSYTTELITDGDFDGLGIVVISTVKEWIERLNWLIKGPDKLHAHCYHAYNTISNRHTALDEDTNQLLNFLDDTYDEAEEEIMQFILQEATNFPNSNTTAEEIAYSFVNNLFLNPWHRINGTSRKDTLVKMLTAAVQKHHNVTRRYAGNTHRKKRSRSDSHDKLELRKALVKIKENNYKAVRSNMDNVNTYMDELDPPVSSDTSAYEYEMKVNYDESDIIRTLRVRPFLNTTEEENNQIHVLRTNSDNDDKSFSENDDYHKPVDYGQKHKETNNIKSLFDKLEKILGISKSSVTPKDSLMHFRGDNQRYPNYVHTVFIPSRFLGTKLINKPLPYDSVTQSLKKQRKKTRITYFNDATTIAITKPSRGPSPTSKSLKVKKTQIKKGRDTHFIDIPRYRRPKKYPVHLQPITELKHKPVARIPLDSRPVDLDADERLETTLNDITLKQLNNQITKHTTSIAKIIRQRGNPLRNGEMKVPRVQNNQKNITKHNADDQHYTTDIIADESDVSDTYSENVSESLDKPSNYRKRKYERLKRKYNMLKRLSKQILSQNILSTKHKQTTSTTDTISSLSENVDEKNATSNASEEFYHRIYETTRNEPKKFRINNINLFLDDYDGKVEIESSIQEPQARSEDKNNLRKSFPLNTTYNNANVTIQDVTETDYSDAEKELKQHIYDTLRHMDFVNYNASRRSDDVVVEGGSHETDLEAVLKTNIYKAVKKLLKT